MLHKRVSPSSAQSAQHPDSRPSLELFGDSNRYGPVAHTLGIQFILALVLVVD
jgi:hypothetical protein